MPAARLRFVTLRCASANGIAQTATSESRINALQRRCALMEEFCFFIGVWSSEVMAAEIQETAVLWGWP